MVYRLSSFPFIRFMIAVAIILRRTLSGASLFININSLISQHVNALHLIDPLPIFSYLHHQMTEYP